MNEHLTITSVNTQMGRLLLEPGKLEPVAHSDVLLLQEVTLNQIELRPRLAEAGFQLAHSSQDFGLAIATKPEYRVADSDSFLLRDRGWIGKKLAKQDAFATTQFRLRGRGLISAIIQTPEDHRLTVVTGHPTVPLRFQARNRQVRDIPIFLGPASEEALVIAGDMNHWPKPRRADLDMARMARLHQVDFGEESTFDVSQTRYAQLGKLAALGLNLSGQLDAMYYRGALRPVMTNLRPVASDHKAVIASFEFTD